MPHNILSGFHAVHRKPWRSSLKRLGSMRFHVSSKRPSAPPAPARTSDIKIRPAGNLEIFFKKLGNFGAAANLDHAAVHVVLQVQFPAHVEEKESYVARAWEELEQQYPELLAEVSSCSPTDIDNPPKVIQYPSSKYSLRDTFSAHPSCKNIDALFSTPCWKTGIASCYFLSIPNQIILRASHWRIDGFGLVMLGDALLSILGRLVQDGFYPPFDRSTPQAESSSTAPSLETLVSKHMQSLPSKACTSDADDLMSTLTKGGQSIGLPTLPGSSTAVPTTSSRVAFRISKSDSESICQTCHNRGYSVTSALNAALIRVTAQFSQTPGTDSYVAWAPVDLRKSLIEAGATECLQPVGSYVSGLPLRINGVIEQRGDGSNVILKSFATLAKDLHGFYSQDVLEYMDPCGSKEKTVSLLQVAEPFIERMTNFFSSFTLPGCPYPQTPVISSFGKMDGFIHQAYSNAGDDVPAASKLQVTDFWVSPEVATPMITLNPWSWGDEITILATWNESFYDKRFVTKVLEMVTQELCSGLNVENASFRTIHNCCDVQIQEEKEAPRPVAPIHTSVGNNAVGNLSGTRLWKAEGKK